MILLSCGKDDEAGPGVPSITLSAPEISNLGLYSGSIEGTVSFEGEELKTRDFGVIWSTSSQPEPADSIQQTWINKAISTINRSPFPIFDIAINLDLNTTYFTRSYFVHENLTLEYGPEISFTTLSNDAWHDYNESQYPGDVTQFPSGFILDNVVYVGIGIGSTSAIFEWWAYNLDQKKWTQKTSIPGLVGLHARGFAIGDKGYILSGEENQNPATFWEYDSGNDRWTRKSDFPGESRSYPLSIAVNGKGYVGGGGFQATRDLWEFDPEDVSQGMDTHGNPMGKWVQKTSHSGASIERPATFTIGNHLYMYNAFDNTASEFWAYDVVEDMWIRKSDFPGNSDTGNDLSIVSFNINGLGYLGGGKDPGFWSYDPTTDIWTKKNDAPLIESDLNFSTDNRGYFFSTFGRIVEYVP